MDRDGEQLVASVDAENLAGIPECDPCHLNRIGELGPLAFTPWNELLIADTKGHSLWRFSVSGELYGLLSMALPEQALPDESIAWQSAMIVRSAHYRRG